MAGNFTLPASRDIFEDYLGDRAKYHIPVKGMFDAGATVTLSSDFDVSSMNPFVGMSHALSREGQSVTLKVK